MKFVIEPLTNLYAALLHLYPAGFRAEFGEEMQVVFRESVNDAIRDGILPLLRLSIRELGGLPLCVLQEVWHEPQGKETGMPSENDVQPPDTSITAGQVILGSLPFVVFGLFLILLEIPIDWKLPAWLAAFAGVIFVCLLILPVIGFAIGWVQRFPRWSYPYAGMAFLMTLYIANVTTPGLNILGYPVFGQELWGWRACVPLGAAFVVALAISRSFQPFRRFFTNLWEDWSILSYLMVGFLPLLIAVLFDEIDRLYSLYFMAPFAVLLVSVAVFYLLGRYTWQRVLALTLGILVLLVAASVGSTAYWIEHDGTSRSDAWSLPGWVVVTLFIMLLPAWLELLRRSVNRLRTT